LSSLREKLKSLEELQKIDVEAHELRQESERLPARRAEIQAGVAAVRRGYDEQRSKLEDNERERRSLESLLGMERDKVKKWEGRLGDIKTPREYAALSREIDIAKKTNETQGEQIRALAASAADLEKALGEREEALLDREETAKRELELLDQRAAELARKLAELEARRIEQSKIVEPSLLGKYENIRRRRAGIAVTPVVGNTCRGCNRNIPPQLSIILQRADSIETCPNCHRIIYSAEAVNSAQSPTA
jgi:uncharacterized protein